MAAEVTMNGMFGASVPQEHKAPVVGAGGLVTSLETQAVESGASVEQSDSRSQSTAQIESLIDILSSDVPNTEVKILSLKDLYSLLIIELKKSPVEIVTVSKILNCNLKLGMSLNFEDSSLYKEESFQHTVFMIILNLRRYSSDSYIAKKFNLPDHLWQQFEQNMMSTINKLSEDPPNFEASVLIHMLTEYSEKNFIVWSDDFQRQVIQRLFLSIDSRRGFRTLVYAINVFNNSVVSKPRDIMFEWLQSRSPKELADFVIKIHVQIESHPDRAENVDLKRLISEIVGHNQEIEAEINDKMLQSDVDKSKVVQDDLAAVFLALDKASNKAQLIEKEVSDKESTSRFGRLVNRVPISALRSYFNNKWRERETAQATTSVEAQLKIEVDNSITLLNSYFLGEPEGKSPEDFLRFAVMPENIEQIRRVFLALLKIYRSNDPEGFRTKILRIFNKALFNPQIVELMPNEVIAFSIEIWDVNLNRASVDNDVEYAPRRQEQVKLKSGQNVANSSKKFLDEQVRKKNELTEIYDQISSQRYQTVFELKKVLNSPELLALYSRTPGFNELVEKLFTTTIERKPLNKQDIEVVLSVYLTNAWQLFSPAVKERVDLFILNAYIYGRPEFIDLIENIWTKQADAFRSLALSYWNLMKTNSDFGTRVIKLIQKNPVNAQEFAIIGTLHDLRQELGREEEKLPEEAPLDLDSKIKSHFENIVQKIDSNQMSKVIKECLLFLQYDLVNLTGQNNLVGNLTGDELDLLHRVLNKLLVSIYLNKRNLVLCSLCEGLFNRITEVFPQLKTSDGVYDNPFEYLEKLRKSYPNTNLVLTGTLQDKVVSMQNKFGNNVQAAA